MSNAKKIRRYLTTNPNATAKDIAAKFGVSLAYVYTLRSLMKKSPVNTASEEGDWVLTDAMVNTKSGEVMHNKPAPVEDVVNHPTHYKTGGIETIDFIEAKQLNYHLGNVVKYITRADHKGDRLENLKKAQWYLEREIAQSAS